MAQEEYQFPWYNLPPKERLDKLVNHFRELEINDTKDEMLKLINSELEDINKQLDDKLNSSDFKYYKMSNSLLLEVNKTKYNKMLKSLRQSFTDDINADEMSSD